MRDEEYVQRVVHDHVLQKERVYINDYSEVPEGAHVQQGPRAGTYYNTEDVEAFQAHIEQTTKKIMAEHNFTEAQRQAAEQTRKKFDDANHIFANLVEAAGEFAIGGSYRTKTPASMMEKVYDRKAENYDGPDDLDDVFGARIYADEAQQTLETAESLVEQIGEDRVVEYKDYVTTPKDGYYRAVHMIVDLGEGRTGEVQVKSLKMSKITEVGHLALYKQAFNLNDEQKEDVQDCLTQVMNQLFGEVDEPHCSGEATRIISEVANL